MMLRIFLLISALFSVPSAFAEDAVLAPVSRQEIRDIQSKLKVEMIGEAHTTEAFRILSILKNIQISDAPLEGRYNQNIVGTDFWGFLTKRIHAISEAPAEDGHCERGAMAYVDQGASPNIAFVCPLFFEKFYSDYEKA